VLKRKIKDMRVPRISTKGIAQVYNKFKKILPNKVIGSYASDSIAFSSTAKYLKKYATLPDEIKEILSPKDAIDMFKDMEYVANGAIKRDKIGQGNYLNVYRTPYLKDYYFLVLSKPVKSDKQVIYSKVNIGDAIWEDVYDTRIQLLQN